MSQVLPRLARHAAMTELADLHHAAHEQCFIANSVTASIEIDPRS